LSRSVLVEHAQVERTVLPEEAVTFGRSERCTICLRPVDEGISRWAGSLGCEAGTWWLSNESETRPFDVVDHLGFVHPLPPGARYAVDRGRVEAVLAGLVHRFCVAVTVSEPPDRPAPPRILTGASTVGGDEVLITAKERLALVAMFAGHLRSFPGPNDEPTTYRQAGRRLGVPPNTVRKRLEHLRHKLTSAGVPNLWGSRALEHLSTYVIATGVITSDDLRLLPPR